MIYTQNARKTVLAALMTGASCAAAFAQGNAAHAFGSGSASLKHQADSIRSRFAANGYAVVEEIPVTMKSESELPVIVNMKQGDWYQVVFIGDKRSKASEVSMYDYDENQVAYKKNQVDKDGNIITYSFVPRDSEYHLIRPVQYTGKHKRTLNGWFMLLQKSGPTAATASE